MLALQPALPGALSTPPPPSRRAQRSAPAPARPLLPPRPRHRLAAAVAARAERSERELAACAPLAATLSALAALPARAAEEAVPLLLQAEGAAEPPPDLLISIMLTLAVALLALITGGVAYLSFAEWKDKQEDKNYVPPPKTRKEKMWEMPSDAKPAVKEGLGDPALLAAKAKGFGRKADGTLRKEG